MKGFEDAGRTRANCSSGVLRVKVGFDIDVKNIVGYVIMKGLARACNDPFRPAPRAVADRMHA